MMMRSFRRAVLGAVPLVALVAGLAGCGGSSSTSTPAVAGAIGSLALGASVTSPFCGSGSTSAGQLTLATGFALQLAPMAFCGASIAFQTGTSVSGAITVTSSQTAPSNTPGAPPAAPGGAAVTPIMFETLAFPAGAFITVPAGSLSPSIAISVASAATCTSFFETIGGAAGNPAGTLTTWQPFGAGIGANAADVVFNSSTNSSTITLGSATVATTYFLVFACF